MDIFIFYSSCYFNRIVLNEIIIIIKIKSIFCCIGRSCLCVSKIWVVFERESGIYFSMVAKILRSRICDEYHTRMLKVTRNLFSNFPLFDEVCEMRVERGTFFCISSCFYIDYCEMSYFVRLENDLFVDSVIYCAVHAFWLWLRL
jgi:hypothetical protein